MASSSSPLLQLIAFSLLLHLPCIAPAALRPETCSSSDPPCQAIVGYVTPSNLALSNIDLLFSVNWTTIVSSNDFDLSTPDLVDVVVPASKLLRIPQTCGCVKNQRVVTSVSYTVLSGNTLSTIASQLYSNLVSYQEIALANNISNPNMIFAGDTYTIPIPCACRNGTNNEGHAAQFVTYQVQNGDELSKIATDYNTTEADLENINGLNSSSLQASSIMFVPLPVCKAKFSGGVIDGNLTVADGSFALTANNCVQCGCSNGLLYCSPTPAAIGSSCSNVTCASSNLTLGAYNTTSRSSGCTVQSCVYDGYTSAGIKSKLESTVDPTCPASPPPPSLYKPPPGLAASPLGSTPSTASGSSPPGSPTVAARPPTADASSIVVGVFFSWVLTLGVTLWLNSWIPCSVL